MGYMTQYNAAQKDNLSKKLTAQYIDWAKRKEPVVGCLVATNVVRSAIGGGEYKQYMFETDEGLVKFALGSATDNEAGALMHRGGVYAVTFKGKESISGGRSINKFEVIQVCPPPDEVVGGGGDVPF